MTHAKLTRLTAALFVAPVLLAAILAAPSRAAASGAPYKYIRIGNPKSIRVSPHAGYALIGGGEDLDQAFQWLCARSAGGDFLVVRASGTDAYNPYIQNLCHENSIATLIIPSRDAAENPFVAQTIRSASAIFIAGGDQANYINFWRGTPVQRELNAAIRRGVPMGGTSAGLAVLGEFAYTSQNDKPNDPNLSSAAALANPFHPQVVIAHNFLVIPALRGVITDSHFHARDRLGRTIAFMARILASGAPRIRAIGIDQHTALLLDSNGSAIAAGAGAVYLFSSAQRPAICRADVPLTFADVRVRKLVAGQKFSLASWSGDGLAYSLSVASGVIHSSQPSASIY